MSDRAIVAIVIALVVIVTVVVLRDRLSSLVFKTKGFQATAKANEAPKPGAKIERNLVDGKENQMTAKSSGQILDNVAVGDKNVFRAE